MKKFFAILGVAVLMMSVLCFSASAADVSTGDEVITGYDNFQYISGWKYKYHWDLEDEDNIYRYIIYTDNASIVPKSPTFRGSTGYYVFVVQNDTSSGFIQEYKYEKSTDRWYKLSSHSGGTEKHYTLYSDTITFLRADVDVLDDNGNVFFPPASPTTELEVAVREMTVETLGTEIPKLSPTVLTLVLCGVGCLALLIGLKILPKVLYKFL